jgi:hypothetical protein
MFCHLNAMPRNYDATMRAMRQTFVLTAARVVDQSIKQVTTNFTCVIK